MHQHQSLNFQEVPTRTANHNQNCDDTRRTSNQSLSPLVLSSSCSLLNSSRSDSQKIGKNVQLPSSCQTPSPTFSTVCSPQGQHNSKTSSSSCQVPQSSKVTQGLELDHHIIAVTESKSSKHHYCLEVLGTIGGKPQWLLCDTGSGVSLIDAAVFKTLSPKLQNQTVQPYTGRIHGLQSPDFKTLFVVDLDYEIGGGVVRKHPTVVVQDLGRPVLLGTDFLDNKTFIDFKNHKLQIANGDWVDFEVSTPDHYPIYLLDDVELPPFTEKLVMGKCQAPSSQRNLGVAHSKHHSIEVFNIWVARGVTQLNNQGHTPIALSNFSPILTTIPKGSIVGSFTPLSTSEWSVHEIVTESSETSNQEAASSFPFSKVAEDPTQVYINPGSLSSKEVLKQVKLDPTCLTPQQFSNLKKLIKNFSCLFTAHPRGPGTTQVVQHHIDVQGHPPLKQRPYRVSQNEREVIKKFVSEMIQHRVAEPSNSPWASPVVLAPKADGSLRFCVDYRKVNAVTRKDVYPIPRIDDTLDKLGKAQFFTTFDLASGYWQIPLSESSKEISAFITPDGLYQYNVMPFGLCNAPPTFQRAMDLLLTGVQWQFAMVYIDDIIIYSKSFEEHLQHIQQVFERLQAAGYKLKADKCRFCMKELPFLGHIVGVHGVKVDPKKVETVKQFPIPEDLKGVRSFLGMTSYYRRFIKGFAQRAVPLTQLLKKDVNYTKDKWSVECQQAFENLKDALSSAPVLAFPDFTQPFQLETDASDVGVAAILSQVQSGEEHVIAYASRTLSKAEKKYTVTEKECLAVLFGVKQFRPYLYGQEFIIITDHSSLRWLMNLKDPNGRLTRWALKLQPYNYKVIHRKGSDHAHVDAPSRYPLQSQHQVHSIISTPLIPDLTLENIKINQQQDLFLNLCIQYLKHKSLPSDSTQALKVLTACHVFVLDDDVLYRVTPMTTHGRRLESRRQVVLPSQFVSQVLEACHEDLTAGHMGFSRTYERVSERFYWDGMYVDIKHYVSSCLSCQTRKMPKGQIPGELNPISVSAPTEMFGLDALGPLPLTTRGNTHLLVFSDYFTRYVECFAVPNLKAITVAKVFVEEVIRRHGVPKRLLTDQGKEFNNELIKEVCSLLGVKKVFTTPYHPQTDGLTERFNKTFCQMVSHYTNYKCKDWDQYVWAVQLAFNSSLQESLKEKPFFLMYGRDANMPIDNWIDNNNQVTKTSVEDYRADIILRLVDAHKRVQENLQWAQTRQKKAYDEKHKAVEYKLGALVWLYSPPRRKGVPSKLIHPWQGPFRIGKRLGPVTYGLVNTHNQAHKENVHVSRLKPFVDPFKRPIQSSSWVVSNSLDSLFQQETRKEQPELLPTLNSNLEVNPSDHPDLVTDAEYEVESIMQRRKSQTDPSQFEYRVRWKHYGPKYDTWEPIKHLQHCWRLVEEFEQQHSIIQSESAGCNDVRLLDKEKTITPPLNKTSSIQEMQTFLPNTTSLTPSQMTRSGRTIRAPVRFGSNQAEVNFINGPDFKEGDVSQSSNGPPSLQMEGGHEPPLPTLWAWATLL